ncbi:single-stranded DNA-binding protein [bacterium]|nr:single-stranded DNA-binding protein [bacterium]
MNLNKAMIIGNLTRDPEVRNIPSGATVTQFSVATNLVWNDNQGQRQEKVEFHNVVAWRKLGEICGQYLKKGTKVYIEGRLQTKEWTGNDGVKRYRTEIIAENMIMLDRPGGSGGASGNTSSGGENEQPFYEDNNSDNNSQDKDSKSDGSDDEEIKVENIPF